MAFDRLTPDDKLNQRKQINLRHRERHSREAKKMLRTLPIASPSSLTVSTYNKTSLPSQSSLKLSPFCVNNDGGNNISYCYSTSRRLALFQLGAAIPQSHFFGAKALKLLRAEGSTIEASTSGNMAPTSNTVTEQNVLDWVKSDKRRMLHVVYRVGDLDKTIKFYTECLGMKLLRKRDIPEDRYTNAFLGYGPEDSHFVVELTYNYGVDKYDIGTGFGHFGIAVEDVAKTVDLVKAKGGKVTREPGPVKGGNTVIAFIEDPDGYKFELLERGPTPEPLCQVMLRVGDLDRAINFYKKYTIAVMGYGPEDKNAVLELTYNHGVTEYDKGNGYAQIAIGTDDVYKTAEAIKLSGGKITREPGPLPGINTKITACLDPDGWKSVWLLISGSFSPSDLLGVHSKKDSVTEMYKYYDSEHISALKIKDMSYSGKEL
ncbi:putative lactoylglutathione lyase [Citrus sinensis]|uniref:Lactoylglutathione lyase n=1 Tax=Citrus sinensis TaxID=2711 RepID=A0ACB8NNX5_CITSI|nr:putative lactoylglutathione lyase [Citrus sinensis]